MKLNKGLNISLLHFLKQKILSIASKKIFKTLFEKIFRECSRTSEYLFDKPTQNWNRNHKY